jgi:ATP-dependent Clp protease ATP-binding subunit ClpC
MSRYTYNEHAPRVTEAKLSLRLSPATEKAFIVTSGLFLASAAALFFTGHHQGLSLAGVFCILAVIVTWMRRDLNLLPAARIGTTQDLSILLPTALTAMYRPTMTTHEFWKALSQTANANFLMLRFGLHPDDVDAALGDWQLDHEKLWDESAALCQKLQMSRLTEAAAMGALFHLCPGLSNMLTARKLTTDDLDEGVHWIARLSLYHTSKRPIYGGIARDWASGFTPLLSHFGENLSRQVELSSKFVVTQERTNQLDALVAGLDASTGSVILVGEPGIGKTALLLGLADRLLQGKAAGSLSHYQIMSLSASGIVAEADAPGAIEQTVLSLFSEALSAGNIIVALDEAQLFFGQGTGAVNLSQVLLPLLQSRRVKLVLAVTPGDWQRLRAVNSSMASLLTPLVLNEPGEQEVMRTLADRSLFYERDLTTTWNALREAYRLSSRYLQDEAYPGKALKILEAAVNYPDGHFISDVSVQKAIESQFGVKVQQSTQEESDVLLHLEDQIHQRMINQSRAVSVVANALRRARAGVSNPKRPIGSFLFLGPTGVGKTELAKSIAALYFKSEDSVIRLDMSEYQQVPDVDRVLDSGEGNPQGLLPQIRQAPFSVVLFDEIEKAHANILNLFLQLLDEGHLTDTSGHTASFKDAIIIATSNAGADEIRQHIDAGEELEGFEQQFTSNLIASGTFKPELLNRFDEIVLFRPLNQAELVQVVKLLVTEVNHTLSNQKIAVTLTDAAAASLVKAGYDPRLGARPMRRMVTRRVEDAVAGMILRGEAKAGDTISLDVAQLTPSPDAKPPADEPTAAPPVAGPPK